MSLHVPAGACIPVASVSPIHVPPVQCVVVYLSIVMRTNVIYYSDRVGKKGLMGKILQLRYEPILIKKIFSTPHFLYV